jgi:hypothetical protein
MSQPVIAKVTLAMVAKHVAVGMVAGTVAVGGAQGAYHVMSSPQSRPAASVELIAPVLGHEHGSPTAPRRAAGRLAPALEATAVDETPTSQVDHPRVPATRNENTGRVASAETELEHFSDDANQPGEDDATPAPNAVDPDSVAAFALPSAERPAAPPAAQRVREEPKGLSAERRFLLRARAAIGRHDPAGALRELDAHAARFPRGRLKGQANVLRVEALLQAERREEALTVGRGEILRAPSRQKVKRIRELFDRKPEQ